MGRSIGAGHDAELEDSVMDPVSKKPTFRGWKMYVKGLDSNTLPPFLARICDPGKPCSYPQEEILCAFDTAAEVHGSDIVPHINQIISTIMRIMSSDPGSLHGCSKVMCTLSRYGIDPLAREEEKIEIISSLCRPLSGCLMNTKESISSGSALCLTALVQSNNWQFASHELVNDICLKVSGALEEACCQTVAHLNLVVALSKQNPLTLEPYGRSLIRSGLQILDGGSEARSSQMIISSIEMIHSIMKNLDLSIISSEISSIIHAMEKFQDDCMPQISSAALQAAETAKKIWRQEDFGYGRKLSPLANYSGRHSRNGSYSHSPMDDVDIRLNGTSESISCDVQSVHRFTDYDSQPSDGQYSGVPGSVRARRRLWNNGSEESRRTSNDDLILSAIPRNHEALGVLARSNSAGLVKSARRCSDVPPRIADPYPMCSTPKTTNQCSQISRRRAFSGDIGMQSTPRKQLHFYNYCSDSERDDRRLPQSPALTLRHMRHCSGQCTKGLLFENNGEAEDRTGYWDSIQHGSQRHVQNTDLFREGQNCLTNAERSNSAGKSPCEERQAENEMMIADRRRNANSSCTLVFLFVCVVVIIGALLLAWWKGDDKELYVVPT